MDLIWQGFHDAISLLLRGDSMTLSIAARSLLISSLATMLAALVGIPLGTLLAVRHIPGQQLLLTLINTGMSLPPVLVGLALSLLLWRSGPFGPLALLYTPAAMVLAQCIVAAPIAAGLTRAALQPLDTELTGALRVDGAGDNRVGCELLIAAWPQVLVALAAAFGRAISEVGASLMVGGNLAHSTRILTTAITLETGRGEFAQAIALGLLLLILAFLINAVLVRSASLIGVGYYRG